MTTEARAMNADLAEIKEMVSGALPTPGVRSHDVEGTWAEKVAPLIANVESLRAVLAPLLDAPWLDVGGEYWICRWCASLNSPIHEPGCPVFRKGELLGRS